MTEYYLPHICTTFAPTPSRILSLLRLVRDSKGSMALAEIEDWMNPRGKRSDPNGGSQQVRQVARAAQELRLVTITGLEDVSIADELSLENCREEQLLEVVSRLVSSVVFRPQFGENRNALAVLSAWWCCLPLDWSVETVAELQQRLVNEGLSLDELGVRNDERWDMLRYWWRFLGFLSSLKPGTDSDGRWTGVFPDATRFIEIHMEQLLPNGTGDCPIDKFLVRLGTLCPVLDGGSVYATLADHADHSGTLSPALNMALARLSDRGILRIWCPDDQREFRIATSGDRIAFIARNEKA